MYLFLLCLYIDVVDIYIKYKIQWKQTHFNYVKVNFLVADRK